jgi:uncharacterized membrane protein (UPF0182 family)
MAAPRGRNPLALIGTILIGIALFIGVPLVTWFAGVWIDYLWFADLGQKSVFLTRIGSELAIGLVLPLSPSSCFT